MTRKMKRLLTLGLCIVLGGMIILTAAFASANTTSGYEELKTAMKNMAQVKSFTGELTASVKDNGKTLAQIEAAIKANEEQDISNVIASITSNGTKEDLEFYQQDGKVIFRNGSSETYNVVECPEGTRHESFDRGSRECDPEAMAIGEKIMDFVVGDLKNQVALSENNGEKTISMSLSEKEIPTVVNLIASLAVRYKAEGNPEEMKKLEDTLGMKMNFKPEMPVLVNDVRIDNADFKAVVGKDGIVKSLTGSVTVAGDDENGSFHKVELDLAMNLSGVNGTTPEKIDLAGKQVKNVDKTTFRDMD